MIRKLSDQLQDRRLHTYIGLYALWAVGINVVDAKTDWVRKSKEGGWLKSYKPPFYWDNWAYTHIGWGMAAPFFGIGFPLFTVLNFINEALLEGIACKFSTEGEDGVRIFGRCDPFPHAVADFMYSTVGYGIGYLVRLLK